MRRARSRVLAYIAAVLIAGVTALSVQYVRGHTEHRLGSSPNNSDPDTEKARASTKRVRADLHAIRGAIRTQNWAAALGRLKVTGHDWTGLEQSTHLTNRHFADGLRSLDKSLSLHLERESMELVGRMDNLLQLLEAVLGSSVVK